MKKPSVPDTNGEATAELVRAVRENVNVMAGRRNNKISVPSVQTLTFSSPPTQAECQALNAYVNAWAVAFKALVARFDD